MTRQDNPFALLGDDDEGSDVAVLLARAQAMIPPPPPPPAPEKMKQKPPALLDHVRGERGRGRGGGGGRGEGRFGTGYSRGYSREFAGRGRGRGRGQFNLEERNIEESAKVQVEINNFGEEGGDSWREVRGHGGGNLGFRGGRGRGWGGRFYGGENRGFGGGAPRTQNGRTEGLNVNVSESKGDATDGKEQVGDVAKDARGGSGGDIPVATDAPKDVAPELSNPPVSEDLPEKKAPEEENDHEMTLNEYEKVLQEKRKALESLKAEERKVVIDKEFERMQLVEKKKEDDLSNKLDKLKKKDSLEKEEKVRKSVSINEFLKPQEGERYPGRGRGGRGGRGRGERGGSGGFRGGFSGLPERIIAAPSIEDPGQFPILGRVAKA